MKGEKRKKWTRDDSNVGQLIQLLFAMRGVARLSQGFSSSKVDIRRSARGSFSNVEQTSLLTVRFSPLLPDL